METTNNPYQTPSGDLARGEDEEYGEIRFFSPSIRIGRLRYLAHSFLLMLALYAVIIAVVVVMGAMGAFSDNTLMAGIIGMGVFVAMIPVYVVWFILMIQRLHDLNHSGWLSLLMLVPLVNMFFGFYMLLAPGTRGKNNYGPPPPPNQLWHWILGLALPVFFIVGILAAIAIPAYQDYTQRAQEYEQGQQ